MLPSSLMSTSGVYPRVCGGTTCTTPWRGARTGLSPRVRGNQRPQTRQVPLHGSIPACAGEPAADRFRSCVEAVYPRVCGGTGLISSSRIGQNGLSPRVRGNLIRSRWRSRKVGSIPACAGEPPGVVREGSCSRVYPRVCGGTDPGMHPLRIRPGLSPRVRGNRSHAVCAPVTVRSIPACAGEPAFSGKSGR